MKVSQLRSATLLIEQIDALNIDIKAIEKAEAANVSVTCNGWIMEYMPSLGVYKEFLLSRRAACEKLLGVMGVDISA